MSAGMAMFKAAGFGLGDIDNLTPGATTAKYMELNRKNKINWSEAKEHASKNAYRLGLPGIALSSFLLFGSRYYDYYRSDKLEASELNRHSIIHSAANGYGTKANAVN